MLGAIAGDMIGSIFEFNNHKSKDFPLFCDARRAVFDHRSLFTDDSVLTVAVAETVLSGDHDYAGRFKQYYRRYPMAGYGARFDQWCQSSQMEPYNSWGNGSAMRVSPVGFAYDDLETVLAEAALSAAVTHNHLEGVKGAQATAASIFLARTGQSKAAIKAYVTATFGYDLERSLDQIRPSYQFNESCQGTVPEAIIAFLESTDFEDAIRNAISLGGDSDTLACITGGIAEAFYGGVPVAIASQVIARLDAPLLKIVEAFQLSRNLNVSR